MDRALGQRLISWKPRSRFDHFTANAKLRFEVNGFPLPVLRFAGIAAAMFAFTHPLPPILDEELSSKLRFFIQNSLIFLLKRGIVMF